MLCKKLDNCNVRVHLLNIFTKSLILSVYFSSSKVHIIMWWNPGKFRRLRQIWSCIKTESFWYLKVTFYEQYLFSLLLLLHTDWYTGCVLCWYWKAKFSLEKKTSFTSQKWPTWNVKNICVLPAAIYRFATDKEYRREAFERSSLYPRAAGFIELCTQRYSFIVTHTK